MNVAGNSFGGNIRRIGELVALAVADEVIVPRDELAGSVEAGLQVMEPAGPVEVVGHVVFARPEQLDGHADDCLAIQAASTM